MYVRGSLRVSRIPVEKTAGPLVTLPHLAEQAASNPSLFEVDPAAEVQESNWFDAATRDASTIRENLPEGWKRGTDKLVLSWIFHSLPERAQKTLGNRTSLGEYLVDMAHRAYNLLTVGIGQGEIDRASAKQVQATQAIGTAAIKGKISHDKAKDAMKEIFRAEGSKQIRAAVKGIVPKDPRTLPAAINGLLDDTGSLLDDYLDENTIEENGRLAGEFSEQLIELCSRFHRIERRLCESSAPFSNRMEKEAVTSETK